MKLSKFLYFYFSFNFLLLCCQAPEEIIPKQKNILQKNKEIKYAKRFTIIYSNNLTQVCLFGNKNNLDTTAKFYIYKTGNNLKVNSKNNFFIKSPCNKIVVLSSIYSSMLCELNCINSISAIDNIDYVNNPQIIKKQRLNQIIELSKGPQIDLEKTITLFPDIIFTFGTGEGEKNNNKKLNQTGIPIAIILDHLESSPLARAEWIKFFAAFVNKKELADSIFNQIEKNYLELKFIAKNSNFKPSVFSEIKYSDAWYVPGGNSYVAQLIDDANANYIWSKNKNTGSFPLSFEQVFAQANDADYWINLSSIKTKKELLGFDNRYKEFNAFKVGNLYNNNKNTNALGYSSYWETGMIYPNKILNDLILIFHPELINLINNKLTFYKKIN